MDKLNLQVLSDSDNRGQGLYDYLFMHIHNKLHNSSIELDRYKGYDEITLSRSKPGVKKPSKKEWMESVAMLLAEYVMDYKEEDLLMKTIRQKRDISETDAKALLGYCLELMNEVDELGDNKEAYSGRNRRLRLLAQDLSSCLDESPRLNLDGALRFRTQRYKAELADVIEYATDEFLMDQQYKEFISLLRYFVYIQDSKIPAAHLMHKGGNEFMLLNEQMKPIDTDSLDTSFKVEFLDKDYNLEDLIVSALITLAPERIYIHTREPELPVIHTIEQIFEERCEICSYCRLCKPILGEINQQDKLNP